MCLSECVRARAPNFQRRESLTRLLHTTSRLGYCSSQWGARNQPILHPRAASLSHFGHGRATRASALPRCEFGIFACEHARVREQRWRGPLRRTSPPCGLCTPYALANTNTRVYRTAAAALAREVERHVLLLALNVASRLRVLAVHTAACFVV